MPIEFQVPNLHIHVREHLSQKASEQVRMEQLLELGEDRIVNMANLVQEQRWCKAFVNRHRKGNDKDFEIGNAMLPCSRHAWGKCLENLDFARPGHTGSPMLKTALSNS